LDIEELLLDERLDHPEIVGMDTLSNSIIFVDRGMVGAFRLNDGELVLLAADGGFPKAMVSLESGKCERWRGPSSPEQNSDINSSYTQTVNQYDWEDGIGSVVSKNWLEFRHMDCELKGNNARIAQLISVAVREVYDKTTKNGMDYAVTF
jgi:hypothetical protein